MTKAEFLKARAVMDFEKRVGVTKCAPARGAATSAEWELVPHRLMVARITRLLASGEYGWARGTLQGIRGVVERTGRVTRRQYEAVEHIRAGHVRRDERLIDAGLRPRRFVG
jgi:hypothetical protein